MRTSHRIAAALLLAAPLTAQYKFFTPKGSFTVEVSLDNSSELRLPIYRNAITSLAVAGDLAIGGTSAAPGLTPFVFAVSLSNRNLETAEPLDRVIPGQRAIQSGLERWLDGSLVAGTMPQSGGASGHIIRVTPRGRGLAIEDLGVPVSGEGVFALAADPKRATIYGVSHPSGKFFTYDPKTRKAEVIEDASAPPTAARSAREYALSPDDYLSRRLAIDASGRVYGSRPVNSLFRYDPATRKVEILADELPQVWGRRALGRVDAWAVALDGSLYGGNAGDGQLFRIDPATGKVVNLGKAAMMPRLKGLAFDRTGALWGVTGAAPGYAHLFKYDPRDRGFVDYGNPRFDMRAPGIEQGIAWRGFRIATVAASEDGRYIVLGEEEALSQLMVFPVE